MKNFVMKFLGAMLFGFLMAAATVSAQTVPQKVAAAKWSGAAVDAGLGNGSCEEALETGLEKARASSGDPLVFVGSNCADVRPTGAYTDFSADYRLTTDSPTTPNHGVHITAYCENGVLGVTASREAICTLGAPDTGKSVGICINCLFGNPIDAGFGNKLLVQTDYAGFGPFPLRFERTYNSARGARLTNRAGIGSNWTHNYERRLAISAPPGSSVLAVTASRPDGKSIAFNLSGGSYAPDPDQVALRLVKLASTWQLINADDEIETYDAEGKLLSIANRAGLTQTLAYFASGANKGQLQSVTDPFGRTLSFAYTNQQLSTLTIPGGGTFTYAYNPVSGTDVVQLVSATDPLSKVRTYHYEHATLRRALTGITDELGVRFATYAYETTEGKAVGSEHAGGAGKVTIDYSSGTTVTNFVTAAVSSTNTLTYQNHFGVPGSTGVTGPACLQCGATQTFYNGTNGLPSAWIDWNLNHSNRGFDLARNLEVGRFEGNSFVGGVVTQTADTVLVQHQWHPTFRLPTLRTEPLRWTTFTYDPDGTQCGARGALCSKSVQANTDPNGMNSGGTNVGAPRVWTYTYNANGQVLTANGPRTDVTDVTTYAYDAQGNVATIANALGHTTQIPSYNVHGQPLTIIDPNGLTTTLAYDARQRLTSRSVGGETTTYDYDPAGQLIKVTLPDASFLAYGYDGAHRLTSITDNLGNKIQYTLDLAGNRTKEEVFDPLNALQQTKSRVYSSLNRLFQELGALNQTTEYGYDNQGNMLTVKDPLNRITTNAYDRRSRLKQVTDPAMGVARYGYNGLSALISVTDPRNLVTSYTLDGLGNMSQQVSPDTGTTLNTYDLAGNLATQTDAKGQVTTYAYDALNRVSLITFHDGSKQAYAYDAGTNGLGRLASITETDPANVVTSVIAYGYDQHGRVTSETRTVNGVAYTLAYAYDASGRLTGMTYPSGRSVAYGFDALGRVNLVTTTKDAQTLVVVQNVQYHPFGGAKSWTLGNGQIYSRTVDQDGRIASYTLGAANNTIAFDAASRITGIAANTYGYDNLDRLTSAILPSSNYAYSYDAVGNRLTKTTGANNDTYTYSATSNRIATLTPFGAPARTFVFDANGSTTNDGQNGYAYDTRGRMVQSTNSASTVTSYQVNALGQRIRKTNSLDDRVFTYDTWGKLIAESDPGGTPKREYIYLGDIPVGVLQ